MILKDELPGSSGAPYPGLNLELPQTGKEMIKRWSLPDLGEIGGRNAHLGRTELRRSETRQIVSQKKESAFAISSGGDTFASLLRATPREKGRGERGDGNGENRRREREEVKKSTEQLGLGEESRIFSRLLWCHLTGRGKPE